MDLPETELSRCSNCQFEVETANKFCRNCGTAQHKEIKSLANKKQSLQQIALFFGIELIFCSLNLIFKEQSIAINLTFHTLMAAAAVLFFTYNWDKNKYILKWPAFSFKKLLLVIAFAATASFTVQFVVKHLNKLFFDQETSFIYGYMFQEYGYYIMLVSIAVLPALFEELAYRGFLIQKLLDITDEKEAIYISSILFFLIHFSFVSFFWLLPFALLLGYMRIKYRTLWYGVWLHFIFNLTTCLVEIYNYNGFQF